MVFLKKLFGNNDSAEFLNSIPDISIKRFIFLTVKVITLTFVIVVLAFISISGITGALGIKLDEQKQFLLVVPFLYLPLILFTVRNFFKNVSDVRRQYTSLKFPVVLKHVLFISLIFYSALFVLNFAYFVFNPSEAKSELFYFENPLNTGSIFNPALDIVFFLSIWLLTGVAEELFFRGAIYRNLRKLSNKFVAILIASLFFVLPHAPSNLIGFISIFSIAVIFTLYYEYKNNLLTITILHFIHDLLGAGLLAYAAAYVARALLHF